MAVVKNLFATVFTDSFIDAFSIVVEEGERSTERFTTPELWTD